MITNEKLRILFVHSGSDLYGASRSLLRLSSRLMKDGNTVRVVLPYDGPLVTALQKEGVVVSIQEVLAIVNRKNIKNIRGVFTLLLNITLSVIDFLKLIKGFRPHLIHTMTSVILSSGIAAQIMRVPHIWHIREFFGDFGVLWQYYQKYILWLSTEIICVSTPVYEQFAQTPKSEEIHILHNGFPVDEFSAVEEYRITQFKRKYLLSADKLLVGVVGRIKFQRKGQDVFVRAAKLLRNKYPDVRFLCIGSPFPGNETHLESLLTLIHELDLDDYVLYTGDVADIKAAISALDVVVLASAQPEPFGGIVVEAMALSRAVVATSIGGSVEQVIDGETGYLVAPGDAISMAIGIEKLLKFPERIHIFGINGRIRFEQKFEFELFYQKILELYSKAIADD